MITINFNNLFCFLPNFKQNKAKQKALLEQLKIELENLCNLNQGIYTFECILSKIIEFLNASYGYIHLAIKNGIITFRPLSMRGISVNDHMFLKNFHNIPLFHDEEYLGTLGFGGVNLDFNKMKLLKSIYPIVAYELHKYNKKYVISNRN